MCSTSIASLLTLASRSTERREDVLKAITPNVPVTIQRYAESDRARLLAVGSEIDVVAVDHYLKAHLDDAHVELALTADSVAALLEVAVDADGAFDQPVDWQPRNVAKQPGEMLRNSFSMWPAGPTR